MLSDIDILTNLPLVLQSVEGNKLPLGNGYQNVAKGTAALGKTFLFRFVLNGTVPKFI